MAGIQPLVPSNRPSDGLRLLRDDEAENLRSEITLLSDTPTGSSTQPKKYIYIKKVHNLKLSKFMKKRRKNYYRVIILNVEQCYCFDLGFLPVLFKKKKTTTT